MSLGALEMPPALACAPRLALLTEAASNHPEYRLRYAGPSAGNR